MVHVVMHYEVATEYKLMFTALCYHSAAPPDQQCAMGFLNEDSLRMIVHAPRNTYSSRAFSFLGIPPMAMSMSMPLTQSGHLSKMVIAARFDVSMPGGWPELQIIRNASSGTSNVVFNTSTEPKPTEYLNVYEYNLTATNFSIEAGDILNISWYANEQEPDQIRFSLAYYNCKTPPTQIPMVSIVVGADVSASNTDLTLNCVEDYTDAPTTSTISPTTVEDPTSGSLIEKSNTDNRGAKLSPTTDVATICGVVIFSLLLTILLILVVICVIVVRRRRKSASASTVNSTGMRYVNEAHPFHDTAGKIILTFLFVEFLVHPYNLQGI